MRFDIMAKICIVVGILMIIYGIIKFIYVLKIKEKRCFYKWRNS